MSNAIGNWWFLGLETILRCLSLSPCVRVKKITAPVTVNEANNAKLMGNHRLLLLFAQKTSAFESTRRKNWKMFQFCETNQTLKLYCRWEAPITYIIKMHAWRSYWIFDYIFPLCVRVSVNNKTKGKLKPWNICSQQFFACHNFRNNSRCIFLF